MKKRDILLLLGAIVIVAVLWMAPEESTTRVPKDDNHLRFYTIVKSEGKKGAEKFCEECHNENGVPFPKDHPPKSRCLLCHKMSQ